MSAPDRIWAWVDDLAGIVGVNAEHAHVGPAVKGALFVRADIHEAALSAARAEGRREGLLEAAGCLSEMAVQTPVGHESKERGSSTYNWLRYCEKWVRTRAAEVSP